MNREWRFDLEKVETFGVRVKSTFRAEVTWVVPVLASWAHEYLISIDEVGSHILKHFRHADPSSGLFSLFRCNRSIYDMYTPISKLRVS